MRNRMDIDWKQRILEGLDRCVKVGVRIKAHSKHVIEQTRNKAGRVGPVVPCPLCGLIMALIVNRRGRMVLVCPDCVTVSALYKVVEE